ncbi:hypothetical protein B484DRAFT_461142, partial [Ochromonadaceae sp. CCMP2298]
DTSHHLASLSYTVRTVPLQHAILYVIIIPVSRPPEPPRAAHTRPIRCRRWRRPSSGPGSSPAPRRRSPRMCRSPVHPPCARGSRAPQGQRHGPGKHVLDTRSAEALRTGGLVLRAPSESTSPASRRRCRSAGKSPRLLGESSGRPLRPPRSSCTSTGSPQA